MGAGSASALSAQYVLNQPIQERNIIIEVSRLSSTVTEFLLPTSVRSALYSYVRRKRREMRLPAFVCLSVSLSVSKITQNACIVLDEILHVDKRRDMDELINFWTHPDHSLDAGTGFLSRISYTLRNFAALPSLAYFSSNLGYFSAISVSICAKLARGILMRDRSVAVSH